MTLVETVLALAITAVVIAYGAIGLSRLWDASTLAQKRSDANTETTLISSEIVKNLRKMVPATLAATSCKATAGCAVLKFQIYDSKSGIRPVTIENSCVLKSRLPVAEVPELTCVPATCFGAGRITITIGSSVKKFPNDKSTSHGAVSCIAVLNNKFTIKLGHFFVDPISKSLVKKVVRQFVHDQFSLYGSIARPYFR